MTDGDGTHEVGAGEHRMAAGLRSEARGRPLADLVLEYVWHRAPVSRAAIARALDMSRSTVSDIVGTLLERGLIREGADGPSRGGRRPVLLEFREDAAFILGVELGASHVGVALTDLRGRVVEWEDRDHPVRTDPEGTIALMIELMTACLAASGVDSGRLLGIGVAVPSPVDPSEPDRLPQVVLPAWHGHSGMERVRAHFGVPVLVDNDANLGAVAEQWWGAGRGIDDFMYIKAATGVGAGYVIRGSVYPGSASVAGEIGHLAMDPQGKVCAYCGNRGCLATLVGTPALVERAEALLPEYPDSRLGGEPLSIGTLLDAALADDPLASRVVEEAATQLGIAVASVLNLLNPAAVIIGGGIARLGERLIAPLREAMVTRTLVRSAAAEIRTSELGKQSIALGAATSVLAAALNDPAWFPEPATV